MPPEAEQPPGPGQMEQGQGLEDFQPGARTRAAPKEREAWERQHRLPAPPKVASMGLVASEREADLLPRVASKDREGAARHQALKEPVWAAA